MDGTTMVKVSLSIDVPDVAAAETFFAKGLGFETVRQEPPSLIMRAGTLEVWLLPRAEGSIAVRDTDLSRSYRRHWTPIHLDIIVDDLEAALAQAISAGATQEGDIVTGEEAAIAFCVDPFGNGFCLIRE